MDKFKNEIKITGINGDIKPVYFNPLVNCPPFFNKPTKKRYVVPLCLLFLLLPFNKYHWVFVFSALTPKTIAKLFLLPFTNFG